MVVVLRKCIHYIQNGSLPKSLQTENAHILIWRVANASSFTIVILSGSDAEEFEMYIGISSSYWLIFEALLTA